VQTFIALIGTHVGGLSCSHQQQHLHAASLYKAFKPWCNPSCSPATHSATARPLARPKTTQGGAQALSPRDIEDLKLAVEFSADYVSVPFVRSAADLQQVGAGLGRRASARRYGLPRVHSRVEAAGRHAGHLAVGVTISLLWLA
jgi:hypothetical protein